jgi:cyclopropane fatty-acyl-phospholipid synthase-like methyltransferase
MEGFDMMIARWHFQAVFGQKDEAIRLSKEWDEQIGAQTDLDMETVRMLSGSVGAREAEVQIEFQINGLGELQDFFDKIAGIKMHEDWGKRMSEVIVSGSTHWQVFRLLD